jgi:hypothetical protein
VGVFIGAAYDLILAKDPTTGLWIVRPKGLAKFCAARRCSLRLGYDTKTDPPWPSVALAGGDGDPPCG